MGLKRAVESGNAGVGPAYGNGHPLDVSSNWLTKITGFKILHEHKRRLSEPMTHPAEEFHTR